MVELAAELIHRPDKESCSLRTGRLPELAVKVSQKRGVHLEPLFRARDVRACTDLPLVHKLVPRILWQARPCLLCPSPLRDADPPSDLETVGINTGVGENDRINSGPEALGQGEEGIAGRDRVDRRHWGIRPAAGRVRICAPICSGSGPPRVDVNDRLDGGVKAVGKTEEGIAGPDGMGETSRAEPRSRHRRDTQISCLIGAVRIHIGICGHQALTEMPKRRAMKKYHRPMVR